MKGKTTNRKQALHDFIKPISCDLPKWATKIREQGEKKSSVTDACSGADDDDVTIC